MIQPLTDSARDVRLRAIRASSLALNGIAYVEVLDRALAGTAAEDLRQQVLFVYAARPFDPAVRADHVHLEGGVRITPVGVAWAFPAPFFGAGASPAEQAEVAAALPEASMRAALAAEMPDDDPEHVLIVGTVEAGDFSPYVLHLAEPPGDAFDPLLASAAVAFKAECPTPFDCAPAQAATVERLPTPRIDYLAKDYASFRRLMLDRLALTMPDWTERSAADVGIALVEVLAYAADELSYYQDAVATEAYLGTARRRVSVRRHARLLNYHMHDGANARAWVHVSVEADLTLPVSTMLLTRVAGAPVRLTPDSTALINALVHEPLVFETAHEADLATVHNTMAFYTWGEEDAVLERGATSATLDGAYPMLRAGDVLILLETRSPLTALRADADPARRHAVRLTRVDATVEDPLGGRFQQPPTNAPVPVTRIEWAEADALPFGLCLADLAVPEQDRDGGPAQQPAALAYGNIVLADQGRTIIGETLDPVPAEGRFRPRLDRTDVTFAAPYSDEAARQRPAAETLATTPDEALPTVTLYEQPGETATLWTAQRDLLASDRFAREFVVETENDGTARLRFGDDIQGRAPTEGTVFQPVYRVGKGPAGNIGAEALGHIVTADPGVVAATNPISARGGVVPEPLERVRQRAPQAFRTQQRAVTPADYAARAQAHPEVQKAIATMRWTGAWTTVFLTVDRVGETDIDADFEAEIRRFLDPFRMAGHDLEIEGPRFVPLDLAMTVCVAAGYLPETVHSRLLDLFSMRDLPDGARGFFHPDRFTFGQPLYLSEVISAVMTVPGVRWVDLDPTPPKRNRFRRYGRPERGAFDRGRLDVGRLEIIRLDNDLDAPENGTLTFYIESRS